MNRKESTLKRLILSFTALLLGPIAALHAADTFLVQDGQPRAEIIIAEKPARLTKIAAKEMQTYVEKVSGAKLTIKTLPSGGEVIPIYVGKSAHTDLRGLGVRWFLPGELGEVVPKAASIVLPKVEGQAGD